MAAPGLGVGDIISACRTIYDYGKKYSDAPEDLRIIADKACSLETTLQRIKYEGLLKGNIVQRAEDPAYGFEILYRTINAQLTQP